MSLHRQSRETWRDLPIQPKEDGSEASEDPDPTGKGMRPRQVDSAQERMRRTWFLSRSNDKR